MKRCIDCGRDNMAVRFIVAQCYFCYDEEPIVLKEVDMVVVNVLKRRLCDICGSGTNGGVLCGRCRRKSEKVVVVGNVVGKRGRKKDERSLAEKVFDLPDRKVCGDCGEMKDIREYYLSNGLPRYNCKVCQNGRVNKWKEGNREKYLEYLRGYGVERRKMFKGNGGDRGIGLPPNE
jgi:hypothetical protein